MNEQLSDWQQRFDALQQRERILLMVTAVVVVVLLLQVLVIDPVLASRERLNSQIKQTNNQLSQNSNELQVIDAQLSAGVNRQKIKQRDQLEERVKQLDERIEQSVVAMIPPKLMPQVLEEVLEATSGLKLISVENKPVQPVLKQEADSEEVSAAVEEAQALYNHGFILRLEGSYLSAVSYFDKLSQLPWKFYWDGLRYRVENYPKAEIILEVHTVSMSEEWIGV